MNRHERVFVISLQFTCGLKLHIVFRLILQSLSVLFFSEYCSLSSNETETIILLKDSCFFPPINTSVQTFYQLNWKCEEKQREWEMKTGGRKKIVNPKLQYPLVLFIIKDASFFCSFGKQNSVLAPVVYRIRPSSDTSLARRISIGRWRQVCWFLWCVEIFSMFLDKNWNLCWPWDEIAASLALHLLWLIKQKPNA